MKRIIVLITVAFLFASPALSAEINMPSCQQVVADFNAALSPGIDEGELVNVLQTLNATNNKKLPDKFINKKLARSRGWRPGRDLWSVSALKGKSIGGDTFGNYEKRLPKNKWREADLDYHGGHRGAKRLIFSMDGRRFVTVDHYQTFKEAPACR